MEQRNSHSLLSEMQHGTATSVILTKLWFLLVLLGFITLVISHKTTHIPTIWFSHLIPWYLPKWTKNSHLPKNPHRKVYSSFIRNCQSLEATKLSFRKWKDKQWSIRTIQYYSVNTQSTCEKAWKKHRYTWLSERNQSERQQTVWF